MNNAFEKFIQENRDAFDTQDPSPLVAEKIKQQIKKNPDSKRLIMPVSVIRWTAVAATVIGVIFMSWFLFQRADNSSNQTAVMQPSGEQVTVQENNWAENNKNETIVNKGQSSSIPATDENLRIEKAAAVFSNQQYGICQ